MAKYNSSMLILFVLLAILAGSLLPIQAVVNSQLGRELDNVVLAALISFIVGALTLIILFLFRHQGSASSDGIQVFRAVHPSLYLGGAFGAIYVVAMTALVPRIGAANTMVAVVLGQVLLSLILDHVGVMELEIRRLNLPRLLGASMVLLGLALVVKH